MAERKEFLRGEIAVRELIAEKHTDDGGHGKGIEDHGLFRGCEFQAGQIAENQRQPGAPDEEFQHHHQK